MFFIFMIFLFFMQTNNFIQPPISEQIKNLIISTDYSLFVITMLGILSYLNANFAMKYLLSFITMIFLM